MNRSLMTLLFLSVGTSFVVPAKPPLLTKAPKPMSSILTAVMLYCQPYANS